MQEPIAPVSATTNAQNVVTKPDMRPTADAAALAQNATPDIPLPVPASLAPVAAVNQSRLSEVTRASDPVAPVERTLKPYGVTMLPHGPSETPTAAPELADDTKTEDVV